MIDNLSQKTDHNICYFQYRGNIMNKVQAKINKPKDALEIEGIYYYPGLELVCNKRLREKGVILFVNYTHKINSINTIKINEKVDNIFQSKDKADESIQI
jgi:hypothetical protein